MTDLKSNQTAIDALLQGLQTQDPRLHALLTMMNRDLGTVFVNLYPIKAIVDTQRLATGTKPNGIATFGYILNRFDITLFWTPVDSSAILYEIRQGDNWDTASFVLRTPSLSALINPTATGHTNFVIKTIGAGGLYCDQAALVDIFVPDMVPTNILVQTIDNNILLSWSQFGSSFAIDHYNIYKSSGGSPALVGSLSGTFFVTFEAIAGTYTYYVEAVDAAGNISARSSVEATMTRPPDFQLLTLAIIDLSLATLTNVIYETSSNKCIVSCDTDETFEEHFTNHSWDDPQDQINAGYDIFIQPDLATAEIVTAELDLGAEVNNVIVNMGWSVDNFPNTNPISVGPSIKGAPADHVYGAYQSGQSVFFSAVRWITIKFEFTGDADAIINFYNLRVAVDVKRELDANTIDCLSSDTTGTVVYIDGAHDPLLGHGRKIFKDVDSITLTPLEATNPIIVICNFVDAPNPTEFSILCFNLAGSRVNARISWKVRGIV